MLRDSNLFFRLFVFNIEGFLCYEFEMKGSCFDVWVWKLDVEISSFFEVYVVGVGSLGWGENEVVLLI